MWEDHTQRASDYDNGKVAAPYVNVGACYGFDELLIEATVSVEEGRPQRFL